MSGLGVERACEWIYHGVWAVLVGWFRVPREPPDLPTGGAVVRRERPSPAYLRYLKFWFWLLLLPIDLLILVGWLAISAASPVAGAILALPALVLAVLPDIVAYVGIHLRYDTMWYVLSDRSMRLRRGLWVIHEATITYENIQNVTITQGPVQRWFGFADLVVHTAGGGGSAVGEGSSLGHVGILQGIDHAAELRDQIMERARASRSAGLGDERPADRAGGARGWTVEHVRALALIRDECRVLAARG